MTNNPRSSLWFVVLVVSCTLLLTGCSTKEEKVANFIAKGDRLLAEDDPVRAILEYKNALQIDPKSAPATFKLGKAYLKQHEYQRAYATFKAALELDAEFDESRVEVAWLLAMGKQGEPALLEVAQIRRPEAFQPRVDLIKARALMASERHQDAVNLLLQIPDGAQHKEVQALLLLSYKALGTLDKMREAAARWRALDPADPASYLILGQDASDRGAREEAVEQLHRMVEAANGDPKMLLLQAQFLDRWGFRKEAETAYEGLPPAPEFMMAQADFWLRTGNRDKARTTLETLVASAPRNIQAVVKLAQVRIEDNNLMVASELLDNTLKQELKKPEREQVLLAKATLLARQADWDAARRLCDSILEENQGNMDAHFLLGKILLSTRNPADAEVHLNQVGVARPKDEEVQLLLVRSQALNKKEAMAADTLKRSVEANPESARLRLELANYYLSKGEKDQVARVLEKGLDLQPSNLAMLKAAGEFEARQKHFARAEVHFRRIIELHPEMPLGYMQMGQLMMARTQFKEAVPWFSQALERENGWQNAVPALARSYLLQKEPDKARTLLQNEVARRPDSPLVHFVQGQVLQATGDLPGAETAFLRAAQLAPQWPDAYRGLAEVFLRQGKLDEAVTRFEAACQQKASLPIRMQLAILYDFAKRPDDAIRVYQELLKEVGQSPALLNNLAYLYAEHRTDKETLAEAGKLAAQALAQEPENPSLLDTAAWLAYRQGDYEAAWKYAQDALGRAPETGVHNLHAAIILHARGQKEDALDHLQRSLTAQMDHKHRQQAETLKLEWTR